MKLKLNLTEFFLLIFNARDGEYISPFGGFFAKHGTIHEVIAPYSSQSNGIIEQNGTLKEMCKCGKMMSCQ